MAEGEIRMKKNILSKEQQEKSIFRQLKHQMKSVRGIIQFFSRFQYFFLFVLQIEF